MTQAIHECRLSGETEYGVDCRASSLLIGGEQQTLLNFGSEDAIDNLLYALLSLRHGRSGAVTAQRGSIKKCKNCGRLFYAAKSNVEYCSSIAPGASRPCNEVGRMQTYAKRVAAENPVMHLYRRAYKTHFARIKAGKMTRGQFDEWKEEALKMRQCAEEGSVSLETYEAWLKK